MNLSPKASQQPGGQIQAALTTGGHIAYVLYRNVFSGLISQAVPPHTREAFFQLLCDVRANTPKDKKFLVRHAKNFTPRTNVGWLAVAASVGYSLSALFFISTFTLGISVTGLSAALTAMLLAGMFIGSALSFLAFVLMVAAMVVGSLAFTCLAAYGTASSSLAVMRYITELVFGPPSPRVNAVVEHGSAGEGYQLAKHQPSSPSSVSSVSAAVQTSDDVAKKQLSPIKTSPKTATNTVFTDRTGLAALSDNTNADTSSANSTKPATKGPASPKAEQGNNHSATPKSNNNSPPSNTTSAATQTTPGELVVSELHASPMFTKLANSLNRKSLDRVDTHGSASDVSATTVVE